MSQTAYGNSFVEHLDQLEALLTCYALNLGRSWWTVASQIATLANFYLTTWEEYHTGMLPMGSLSEPCLSVF